MHRTRAWAAGGQWRGSGGSWRWGIAMQWWVCSCPGACPQMATPVGLSTPQPCLQQAHLALTHAWHQSTRYVFPACLYWAQGFALMNAKATAPDQDSSQHDFAQRVHHYFCILSTIAHVVVSSVTKSCCSQNMCFSSDLHS